MSDLFKRAMAEVVESSFLGFNFVDILDVKTEGRGAFLCSKQGVPYVVIHDGSVSIPAATEAPAKKKDDGKVESWILRVREQSGNLRKLASFISHFKMSDIVRGGVIDLGDSPEKFRRGAGFFSIFGGTGAGKSTILRHFPGELVRAGEPEGSSLPTEVTFHTLVALLYARCVEPTHELASFRVDSFREFVYASSGNTLKSGISGAFLQMMGFLSRLAERADVRLMTVVNPMEMGDSSSGADLFHPSYLLDASVGSSSGVLSNIDWSGPEPTIVSSLRRVNRKATRYTVSEWLAAANDSYSTESDFVGSFDSKIDTSSPVISVEGEEDEFLMDLGKIRDDLNKQLSFEV